MGIEGRRSGRRPRSEEYVCPVCGQPVGTVIHRRKILGAFVPVWGPGPCRNPDCSAYEEPVDAAHGAGARRSYREHPRTAWPPATGSITAVGARPAAGRAAAEGRSTDAAGRTDDRGRPDMEGLDDQAGAAGGGMRGGRVGPRGDQDVRKDSPPDGRQG
ncbi:hypothetical protein H1V43_29965 [Streptomyces sp. PSKA54]|uniref:Uncharacterized protein n=1 Tax=Streptomyces himalayensis subsp. aureolus TaxID=2758039 RepID=A0A7W2D665_9ACTN|nr:hypothetical protein [Streptomyces himalayensis]MBA4865491.1 hypothetical protein [Streptomyces himalayensis subsp. aureolus]